MKKVSTNFLRLAIILIGISALAGCIFALPSGIKSEFEGDFDYGWIMLCMYLSAIPFFIALFQAMRLLSYIDKNKAFSKLSIKVLRNIKLCASIIALIYILSMPYIFYLGDKDDAPGVVAVGLIIIFACLVIATASAVFQRLFQNAVDIKSENDLTV